MADEKQIDFESAEGQSQLLKELLNKDPEIRDATLRNLAKLHPDIMPQLPELRADDKIEKAITRAKQETLAEIEAKQRERDTEAALAAQKASLKQSGLSDDDIKKVEQLMVEKKIASYDSAAEFYRLSTQPAAPAPGSLEDTHFSLPSKESKKELWANPNKYALDKANEALADILKARQQ